MKEFLRHLFFPRESNNHRAKLLHHSAITYVIIGFLTLTFFFSFAEKNFASVLSISANISAEELITLVNKERQDRGLSTLRLDEQLSSAAYMKAQDMFANDYWAHTSPAGISPWVFIKSSGYEYLYAGENLARGFTTSNDVVKAWMKSPSHRENMLSPNYDEIGFAIASGNLTGEETVLIVEMFGRRFSGGGEATIAPIIPAAQSEQTPLPPNFSPNGAGVASIRNQPLINSQSFSRHLSIVVLALFISVFVIDIIIIERKKIIRIFSHTHNVDHMIFLTIILLAIIVISRGSIL